ncbi:DUF6442 family protein [Dysosmobacter sp.]|uniref:DUF6442 family protein n=1 Tax=Dysosmobacter sp. TaxID=2591382 RepID=UPI002A969C88|nr:DUF6442 family protein [Dysosmobacter sp.]MCI6054429.1 DUF6442 family protein [Dysosmobacter sp.]MDY5511281.1 DUF6442 family protein [Dysosmobacter sp.]
MDREDILKKARAGNAGLDEREQQMLGVSFGFGAMLMTLLCVILAAVRLLEGGQVYEYVAIISIYLAGTQGHQYWKTRRMLALVCAAVCTLVCAANLTLQFLG